ncbi:major facilitator superfamily domain-containing protein [Xylariaceae sp. FL0804]|nr:major facilitator superfamily domain-containing protein [Xylariaceae sp. FL0804]
MAGEGERVEGLSPDEDAARRSSRGRPHSSSGEGGGDDVGSSPALGDGDPEKKQCKKEATASSVQAVSADDDEDREAGFRSDPEKQSAGMAPPTGHHDEEVEASVVPVAQRRGLLAFLALVPEVEQPQHDYSDRVKWMLTSFVALAAGAGPMGSAIFYPVLGQISADLHAPRTIVNFSIGFYMLSMSIFPLWWSSFSETLGRRSVYLVSFALNVLFTLLSGLARSTAVLVAMRVLAGGAAASVQAVGAGTIADLWESRERGRAMGLFYLGPLCGPLLAPIVGGGLAEAPGGGWRAAMWFLAGYGALVWLLVLFGLPETLAHERQHRIAAEANAAAAAATNVSPPEGEQQPPAPPAPLSRVSSRASQAHTAARAARAWAKRLLVDPLAVLGYMRYPAVALIVVYAALTFGSVYVLNISVQAAFGSAPYGYSPVVVGLLYFPASAGYFLASVLGGPWIDRIMAREARRAGRFDDRGRLVTLPEDRMRENAWLSASLWPAALVWWGWTAQRGLPWPVPSLANFFFGVGSMLVFSMATTMLTELMPRRSSSGVALNNFVRNILSFLGGVIAQPLIDAIGNGWLCTAVALVAWVAGNACLFLLRRNSVKWRQQLNEALA